MCFSGRCKHEDSLGDCTCKRGEYDCPEPCDLCGATIYKDDSFELPNGPFDFGLSVCKECYEKNKDLCC